MLGSTLSFVDALNQETLKRNQGDSLTRKKSNPLRPSSAGACPASLAYALNEFLGLADYRCAPLTPEASRIFALGHSIEEHFIQQLEASGIPVIHRQKTLLFGEMRSRVNPDLSLPLQGSIDGILVQGDFQCLVDFKSVGGAKFFWDAKSKKYKAMKSVVSLSDRAFYIDDLGAFLQELNDPFLSLNLLQANFYAHHPWIQSLGVDHAAILQYSKVNSEIRELRFQPSLSLFQKSLNQFQEVLEAIAGGDPEKASKAYEPGNIACTYCRYLSTCRKQTPAESSAPPPEGASHGLSRNRTLKSV
jgi:hypothetical protein